MSQGSNVAGDGSTGAPEGPEGLLGPSGFKSLCSVLRGKNRRKEPAAGSWKE